MKESDVEFIKWFSEFSNIDVDVAGGKGASLSEMYNLKMPIPPGFVITAQAYSYFIKENDLGYEIKDILDRTDVNNVEQLHKASENIREIIEDAPFPRNMRDSIIEAYEIESIAQKL